jgi:hypothetical protein
MPSDRERLTRLVMMGPSSLKHCFKREVGIGSREHCLSVEEKMSWWISERVVGRKLKSFEGGVDGKMKGSGVIENVNLARIRSILSEKNSRNELARVVLFGSSGREFGWLR